MTPEEQFELDLLVEMDILAAKKELRARKEAEAEQARSAAMGGPTVAPEEQARLDAEAMREAERRRFQAVQQRPPGVPLPPVPPLDVTAAERERSRITTPGGAAEEPYLEAREGVVPFLRPTRIEEVPTPGPIAGPATMRVIREQAPFPARLGETVAREPTATEEFVEAFARQPVLTREAGRQLAAGAEPSTVQRRVGELGGAVVETPFQAVMRAVPTAVPAMAVEAYRAVGSALTDRTEPIPVSGSALPAALGEAVAGAIEGLSPTAARYVRNVASVPAAIEGVVAPYKKPVQAARLFEEVTGQKIPVLSEELATIGEMRPFVPAPAAIADKPISQRIREGETVADVMASDPKLVAVYDREFGALAPAVREVQGLMYELPLPLTPFGAVTRAAKVVPGAAKAGRAVSEAVTGALTKAAVKQADTRLANKVYENVVGSAYTGRTPLTLDTVQDEIIRSTSAMQALDLGRLAEVGITVGDEAGALRKFTAPAIEQARRDLARVAPRTDLVRVSPSYAVPKSIAPKVTTEAAADVSRVRTQAQAAGRSLTRAEEAGVRDAAVRRAAQAEARRLDELGQFQVLLDGIDTPRVWDGQLVRAVRAVRAPEQAMKRAAVTAAEQEVARQGMNALRVLRREVEAGSAAGKTLNEIIEGVGARELAEVSDAEVVAKVLEEAYGGLRGRALLQRIPEGVGREILRPDVAAGLHAELVRTGALPRSTVPPAWAANATKIILEEGVRKRISEGVKAAFDARYPDIKTPTLAVKGAATLEELKFFENGAEELFRLADSIPTRGASLPADVQQVAELVAAAVRNVRQKVRIPIVAEARLLAGERFSAPVRAYLTTRYGIPAGSDLVGVTTPYGYLRPDDLQGMIDALGGFGPSRMDVARRGLMVGDILRAADTTPGGKAIDLAFGRPMAYAAVDGIEEGFRRGVFVRALQEGKTPEAAIELARRSQLDYGAAGDDAIIQALAPYWSGFISTAAQGREFIDRAARNPGAYVAYLRALRAQQEAQDPEREQGDLPLTRFYAPLPEGATTDLLGRPIDVLGPSAPLLAPVYVPIAIAQAIEGVAAVGELALDGELIGAALDGSTEALDELAARSASLSAGFGGEVEPAGARTTKRTGGGPTLDQTYMATLAIARAYDPDGSTGIQAKALELLAPDVVMPPKALAAGAKSSLWTAPPPKTVPGTFVYRTSIPIAGTDERQEVFAVIKPSKVGRQRIQALSEFPLLGDPGSSATRIAGTALESGVPEAVLWAVGAETVEAPTRQAVEQTR